ncbi:hypothetical protein C1H71_01700 [Iodobacter fluviatilis]|jgi:arsenate reductase|uniref:Uncharacterized protein n=2 Tax=Iodobacter fluviatilis TaxID=537 RepID=A0A7G3G5J3_9NEIS|nr:hypothetical protein C1H71_01700 [Iodobacter fluviatilis]
MGYETSQLHSKFWQAFEHSNAPHMDIIITVCDKAHGEACPTRPGHPISAQWGYEDPHGDTEEEKRASYSKIFTQIKRRIDLLVSLSSEKPQHLSLNDTVKEIG